MCLNKIELSICIPTYNRAAQLKETLEALVLEKSFIEGRVEIVISDNASSDETEMVGRMFSGTYENITYHRNNQNIGNDNFPMAISKASGILRKLNNDTFKPVPGAIDYICNLVEEYYVQRPVLFFANGNKARYDKKSMPFHEFAVNAGYWVTWIAAFSIWEDDCENIEKDTFGAELHLWQVRKTYELAYKKNACVIIDGRIGNTLDLKKKNISYGLHKVFYENYLSLLEPYLIQGAISESEFSIIKKDLLFNFFTNWIIRWELQDNKLTYSKEENLKEKVFSEYKNEPYWGEFTRYYSFKKVIKILRGFAERFVARNKNV